MVKIPKNKPKITLSDSNLKANVSTHIRGNVEEVHPFVVISGEIQKAIKNDKVEKIEETKTHSEIIPEFRQAE